MGLMFVAPPRMAPASFARVLLRAGSPAAAQAGELFASVAGYGLDPAVALAFFAHESGYGRFGVAARSLNWGNLRRGARAYAVRGGFGFYHSWEASLRDWCELIETRYVARGLATVELAVPVYAPSGDGNAPERYIRFVTGMVATWEAAERAGAGLGEPVRRVVAVAVANVRSAPALGKNVVAQKRKGTPVGGVLVAGAAVAGCATWLKLGDGQYMHASVLI